MEALDKSPLKVPAPGETESDYHLHFTAVQLALPGHSADNWEFLFCLQAPEHPTADLLGKAVLLTCPRVNSGTSSFLSIKAKVMVVMDLTDT